MQGTQVLTSNKFYSPTEFSILPMEKLECNMSTKVVRLKLAEEMDFKK